MKYSRRQFIHRSGALSAGFLLARSLDLAKKKLLLSFSTLGCPDWDFTKITDFAAKNGYSGIEVRGILREMDLPKCDIFSTPEKRSVTLNIMKQKKLRFVNLGSSANMHIADASERRKNLDEGRRFIDLAQQLNCPFVRVFPNSLPKDRDKNETLDLIAKGLLELGDYAKGSNVTVLMETHGELTKTEDLEKIMQSARHKHTGLVWDVTNMWTITKEPPVDVYRRLKKYIHHTHIKDAKLVDDKVQYVLMGKGEVPIFEAIDVLDHGGYNGYYSFEWEKLWHPEIAEPEIALADYPKAMQRHFDRSKI